MPCSPQVIQKAQQVKLVITDVDGVLTNGRVFYTNQGETLTGFHIQDGYGIRLLLRHHISVAVLTGRKNPAVMHRMRELGVEHVYQGLSDKVPSYDNLLKILKLQDESVAYIGDDLPDLPVLRRVGLSVAPADANHHIRSRVDWVTEQNGGFGAFRALADLILEAKAINVVD